MIKNEALKWLVENVTRWPTPIGGIASSPNGWVWASLQGDIYLIRDIPTEMYVDYHIEQKEWLNYIGESLVEPMSHSDAFNWVYERYSKNLDTWPDCNNTDNYLDKLSDCTSPNGWSWCYNIDSDCGPPELTGILFNNDDKSKFIYKHQLHKYVENEKIDTNQAKLRDVVGQHLVYYIAGPMSGLPNFNRDNFNRIASELDGHILNPATLPNGLSNREYMSICLPMLQCATHIYMLKGWEKSEGAIAEHALASKLLIGIEYE